MATLKERLETARLKQGIEIAKLGEVKAKARRQFLAKAIDGHNGAQNKFDFTSAELAGKKRGVPVERGRTQEKYTHPRASALEGYALARDTVRNNDLARSMLNQIVWNVIGKNGGKAYFNTDNTDWNKAAQKYVWKTWAKECDGAGSDHWNTKLKKILASALTDGDVGIVVDDFSNDADGRIYVYTADMISDVEDPQNVEGWEDGFTQVQGFVHNRRGRAIGMLVARDQERGKFNLKAADTTFYKFGKSAFYFRPYSCSPIESWVRGVSVFATAWLNMEGLKEMRSKELDTAGLAASIVMQILGGQDSAEEKQLLAAGGDPDELIDMARLGMDTAEGPREVTRSNYEELESMRGARVAYMSEGEKAEALNLGRPNLDTETYYQDVSRSAGASIGLGSAYTRLQADRAYTAFRGETLMTWVGLFENLQKEVERDICDRIIPIVVQYAIDNGLLEEGPEDWDDAIAFQWPVMPEVNPVTAMEALGKAMGFGLKTPADVLGPDGNEMAIKNRKINDSILGRQ